MVRNIIAGVAFGTVAVAAASSAVVVVGISRALALIEEETVASFSRGR